MQFLPAPVSSKTPGKTDCILRTARWLPQAWMNRIHSQHNSCKHINPARRPGLVLNYYFHVVHKCQIGERIQNRYQVSQSAWSTVSKINLVYSIPKTNPSVECRAYSFEASFICGELFNSFCYHAVARFKNKT